MAVRRGNTLEIWSRGLRLGTAWFVLSDLKDKEQYRTANEASLQIHKGLMEADLLTRLFDGELKAYRIQVSPKVDDGPIVIPNFLFSEPDIDWDASSLKAFGRVYENVRVDRPRHRRSMQPVEVRELPCESEQTAQDHLIKPKPRHRGQPFPAVVAQSGVAPTVNDSLSGTTGLIGRPSVIDRLREVVREVATTPGSARSLTKNKKT